MLHNCMMCQKLHEQCPHKDLLLIKMILVTISSNNENGTEKKHVFYMKDAKQVLKKQLTLAKVHHMK